MNRITVQCLLGKGDTVEGEGNEEGDHTDNQLTLAT